MSFIQEFKAFAMRGNVIDLAVGVIIGGAFGKIVASLVNDMLMPVIGALIGGVNFKDLYINLGSTAFENLAAAEKAGAPIIKYGAFINSVVDFALIALVVFIAVKAINRLQQEEPKAPEAPPATPEDVLLLREIRDALKK